MAMNTSANNQQHRKGSNQNIQVYVRVRPLNARERCMRSAEIIDVVSPREIMTRHSFDSKLTKKFTFDRAFGAESRQVDVYSTVVAPLIEEVLAGYNCTVFAYGQTGTGKTHTMVGNECAELKSSWEDDSEIGIIPRALSHLFDELRLMELEFSMRISYLELYNEELCDLLSSDDSTKIRIFDDTTKKGSVIIQGLEEIPVHSKDDVYKLLEKGKERRKTASTLMNAQSSRSHTVFSILVHIRENGMEGEEMLKIGKLNLVDLAGSENVSKAGNEKGIRVRETVNINQSLLTLGRVITALVERTPHIPYRESKLTRLLQESLGGRTKTSIIATISPGHKDIEETLSTLEYAHRAKNIQNKPEVNQKLTKRTVLKEYTEEIDKLKRDLMAARDKNGIYLAEETYHEMTLKMDSQNRELNEKMLLLKALKDELQNKEKIFNDVSLSLVEKTEELERSKQTLTQTKGALLQTKKILNTTKRRYKEKKVLLESHLKTEAELTNQASQILQVADIATQDTQQLHSTIERRKHVDKEIQNVCERFVDRMRDNFELMDDNLKNLQEQQKSHTEIIMEEFTNSSNNQNKLLNDATQKIKGINDICNQSLGNNCAFTEKYIKAMQELSVEQRTSLKQLLEEVKNRELELSKQVESSLHDLQEYNKQQKSSIDLMKANVAEKLQSNSQLLTAFAANMQEQFVSLTDISVNSLAKVERMQKELQNEHALAVQEQAIIDEFVEKMNCMKQKRLAGTDNMSSVTEQLELYGKQCMQQLEQNATRLKTCTDKHASETETAQKQLEESVQAAVQWVDQSVVKCVTLQTQLNDMCQDSGKRITACIATGQEQQASVDKMLQTHESEAKRMRVDSEQQVNAACSSVQAELDENMLRLKNHTALGVEFHTQLQAQVQSYAKLYKEQMTTCVKDVEQFKQSELQTYAPTGATPSKRDFTYPRVLANTSPHDKIVKRFRQENDWSDLDTTAVIDEESVAEEPDSASVHEISAADTILNSTPLEPVNANSFNASSSNSLKVSVPSRNNSLTANVTTRKMPSPARAKNVNWNKENVS